MTLSVTDVDYVTDFDGDGTTKDFGTGFVFFDAADIEVIKRVDATEVETVQSNGPDYTLTGGVDSEGKPQAGTVSMTVAPAVGESLFIRRIMPQKQDTNFIQNTASDAETVENRIDKIYMYLSQLLGEMRRTFRVKKTSAKLDFEMEDPVANFFPRVNSAGTGIEFLDLVTFDPELVAVSTFMRTVLDDTTATAAQTTLGVLPGTDVQVQDAALQDIADLTLASGDVFYVNGSGNIVNLAKGSNGNVLTLAAGIPAWQSPGGSLTLATEQATTSGTEIDFTGIPAGVKEIHVMFVGVSISGTADFLVQIGDSGGIETTGYNSCGTSLSTGANTVSSTAGFVIRAGGATVTYHGTLSLYLEDASDFTWTCQAVLCSPPNTSVGCTAGTKALSAELDRIRITTTNGTDTFDAGVANVSYF